MHTDLNLKHPSYLLLIFLVFSIALPAQAHSAKDASSLCLSTEAHKPAEQLSACTQALKAFPKQYHLWQRRAQLYMQQRKYAQASQDFSEALKLQPQNFDLLMARAMSYQLADKKKEAQADALAAKKVRDKSFSLPALMLRGMEYTQEGQWDDAIAVYTEALKQAPSDYEIYYARGSVYAAKEDIAKFEADFNKAIDLAPQESDVYARYGKLYIFLKQYGKAIHYLSKAIILEPQSFEPWADRGAAQFMLLGNFESIEDHAHDSAYLQWQIQSILEDLNEALKRNPQHEPSRTLRALTLGMAGQFAQQIQAFNQLLQENPDHVEYLAGRMAAYYTVNQYSEALTDAERLLELKPEDKTAKKYQLWCLLKLNKRDLLSHLIQTELNKDPDQIEILNFRGYLALLENKFLAAAQDFKQTKALGSLDGKNMYAFTLALLKQFPEAQIEITQVLKTNPTSWEHLHTQAWIYELEKKTDQAISVFQQSLVQLMKTAPFHLSAQLKEDIRWVREYIPELANEPRLESVLQTLDKPTTASDLELAQELYATFFDILSQHK